nr:immunoglobulin heavy chain junction region [Macaca mulatta]MOX61006.1 immunoglobulin heavy chain junction region [Macaca mulatta]MOX63209.1 immunoglobulin heavy chain junction region [Macaca mulatta]MOX67505.1 immunoglobulin heavy chain junction region [Macaca mulatta]
CARSSSGSWINWYFDIW